MSRLTPVFEKGRGTALVGFTVAGDPDYPQSLRCCLALCRGGADVLELGVPFTDPVADGPVIQHAHERALSSGMTTDRLFSLVRGIREEESAVPIVLLVYYNLVFKRGVSRFYREAKDAGIDGILVVDLPLEEAGETLRVAGECGVDPVMLVAPGTSDERLRRIASVGGGFLYLASLLGTTGAREELSTGAVTLLTRVRPCSGLPLCVGFGISTPDQARALASAGADGVIVGSAIVARIASHLHDPDEMLQDIGEFTARLKGAIRAGSAGRKQ